MLLAQSLDGQILSADHNAIALEPGDSEVGRQRFGAGVDDGSLATRRRHDGGDHGEGAVLETLAAERYLVGVAIEIGTGSHLRNAPPPTPPPRGGGRERAPSQRGRKSECEASGRR